jgi:hypothetical protein
MTPYHGSVSAYPVGLDATIVFKFLLTENYEKMASFVMVSFSFKRRKNSLKILPFLYHSKIVFMQNRGFIKLNFKKGCG